MVYYENAYTNRSTINKNCCLDKQKEFTDF